ncbi:undecaprenyl-diphosphate phosphatase [Tunturiibacter gelidoferens]|jgi:undecaprenyl-diphosphatase|uniref:Undecaprenyl-diphosphatase n=1 Tax=Tunturiibacter gelidiferens TaxID=3069689 RepID=A0A9X0QDF2_9BACT|nr:undecaprenyl-diphosphate phosphatase [Edaphobacter lichenicola]MBB5328305.1 undecaprenyl-diphosphatase [Edaphobacter lichenicola]
MSILHVIILAIVQGLAELLPVSSSAHVVVAEKLLGLDPTTPQMTLLLVMLHTGTMFAVIVYFWKQWKKTYFSSGDAFKRFLIRLIWASLLTAVIGEVIVKAIEKTAFKGASKGEIELLFGRLDLIAPALAAAGLLILLAGLMEKRRMGAHEQVYGDSVTMRQAGWIGAIQGLCLPFRGFSRSGATISTGMLAGASKERAERFSFALAVVLTPPAVGREVMRLVKASHAAQAAGTTIDLHGSMVMGLLGAVFAFLAGLVALRWLSSWLEEGRWYLFGIYCLVASVVVFGLYHAGY